MLKEYSRKAFRSCHCDWSTAVIRSSRAQRAVAPGLYHTRPTDNCVWIARKLIQLMNKPIEFSARSEACCLRFKGSDAILVQSWYLRYSCGNR